MACTSKKQAGCSGALADKVQALPTAGSLRKNLDFAKAKLGDILDGERDDVRIYSYVMTSVKLDHDILVQTGCGPNFQGGRVTLCACKHKMRTSLPAVDWKGKWIAGFTSLRCGRRHWLFYLAEVKEAYESHCELWHALPPKVRTAKSAMHSRLGDLFEPTGCVQGAARPPCDCECKFALDHYHKPPVGHVHRKNAFHRAWKTDIDYRLKTDLQRKPKRPASLLVGDPRLSFLWQEPILFCDGRWRVKRWGSVAAFLHSLKEAG